MTRISPIKRPYEPVGLNLHYVSIGQIVHVFYGMEERNGQCPFPDALRSEYGGEFFGIERWTGVFVKKYGICARVFVSGIGRYPADDRSLQPHGNTNRIKLH
jgi:hypothetical protein